MRNTLRNTLLSTLAITAATTWARESETGTSKDGEAFLAMVTAKFATWDADSDGILSPVELNAKVADATVQGDEAAAIATLKRTSRLTKIKLPTLNQDGIASLTHRAPETGWPKMGAMFAGSQRRIAKSNRVLFASGLPRLDTVRQGQMGNCFSLAPLGALAFHRPEFVAKEMIQKLPDERYQVRLGKETVVVTAPTDAELALTASNDTDGFWVNVYEKAAGDARNAGRPVDKREANGLDVLNKGGSAGTQLAFITGHEMFRLSCKFAKEADLPKAEYDAKLDEIRTALTAATKEQRMMTTGTLKTKIPGITPNHAYAVLSYKPEGDLLQIWNPHGDTWKTKGEAGPEHGYPMENGIFEMPLTVFVKDFAGLAFEVLPKKG